MPYLTLPCIWSCTLKQSFFTDTARILLGPFKVSAYVFLPDFYWNLQHLQWWYFLHPLQEWKFMSAFLKPLGIRLLLGHFTFRLPRHMLWLFNFPGCSDPISIFIPNFFNSFILIIWPTIYLVVRIKIIHLVSNGLSYLKFIIYFSVYIQPRMRGFKCICEGSCWTPYFNYVFYDIFYFQKPHWSHPVAEKYVSTISYFFQS